MADTREPRKPRKGAKTAPAVVRATVKAAEAVRLRAQDPVLNYAEIAKQAGYKHRQSAYRAVRLVLARVVKESGRNGAVVLDAELQELDDLVSAAWERAMNGELDAIDAVRKVIADRRKLLGTDAAAKIEVTTPPREQLLGRVRNLLQSPTEEIAAILEETGWVRR